VKESLRTQSVAYLTVDDEATFVKRAKHMLCLPMAQYLVGTTPPSVPDLPWSPSGQWLSWSQHRIAKFSQKNTHLWYSWLQAKRAALPLSEDLIRATYEDHRKAMGGVDPIQDSMLDQLLEELEPVLRDIRSRLFDRRLVLDEATGESVWEYSYLSRSVPAQHVASTRACYENPRQYGGQLAAIAGGVKGKHLVVPNLVWCNPLNPTHYRRDPELVGMTFHHRVVVGGAVRHNVVLETWGYPSGEYQWYDYVRKSFAAYAKEPVLLATIQAVVEPLKVRVISKGNAIPYYASKPLQRILHDIMREMPPFRLIGRPLQATDLFDLAHNPVWSDKDESKEWFSVDYSAATDGLSARLSASILGRLVDGLDPTSANVWKKVLAPHWCEYPPDEDRPVEPIQQTNGQLMGSILSFPILCLANLGVYLVTCRSAGDRRTLKSKMQGVLVNGDDMLYVAPKSLWAKHCEVGEAVGLKMSPGKAYHHDTYANANSACYHYDLKRAYEVQSDWFQIKGDATGKWLQRCKSRRSSPKYIPFFNVGLFFGQNKVLSNSDDDQTASVTDTKSYCSVINRMLEGARRPADVLAMYLKRFRREINLECAGRNLFLHPSLGGMGVSKPDGFKTNKPTGSQRALALEILRSDPYFVVSERPLRHPELNVEEAPSPLKAPWLASQSYDEETDEVVTRTATKWRHMPKYEVGMTVKFPMVRTVIRRRRIERRLPRPDFARRTRVDRDTEALCDSLVVDEYQQLLTRYYHYRMDNEWDMEDEDHAALRDLGIPLGD
jgi:hypothetical protein